MTIITNRIIKFFNGSESRCLEEYFNMENTPENKITIIAYKKEEAKIELQICAKKFYYYNFIKLPLEISNCINEYLDSYIIINFELLFPIEYPFNPIEWSFISVNHNIISSPIILEEYYNYIIKKHNYYNDRGRVAWGIEKDILEIILKINHFEYLII